MLHLGFTKALLIFLILFLVSPANAQDCAFQLHGLVEEENGDALIGATIYIETLKRGVATDQDGKFTLKDLCGATYQLAVRYVGFEDQHITLKIPLAKSLVIKLKPSLSILHDVIVEGRHSREHSLSQSLSILTQEQLSASRGKSLGEMLQQAPGVQSIMTGGAIFKPVVHGLFGQRLLILNNGLRQEGQQWGLEHAPEIDSYIASEIEVVKGSEAVRYGADALGGAIIVSAQPLHYLSSLSADLNAGFTSNNRGVAFSGMLEDGLSKSAAWRIQGTVKKGGDYHAPDYNLSNTGFEEIDLSTTFGYEKDGNTLEFYASTFNTEIGILRSAHVGNLSDLQESIISEQPWYIEDFTYEVSNPRQKISHHLIKLDGGTEIGEGKKLRAVYGIQHNVRKEFDVKRGSQHIPSLALDLWAQTLDLSFDHEGKEWSGSVGLSGSGKDNYNERASALLPDYRQFTAGIFAIEKFRRGKWLFEGGVRADHQYLKTWMFDHEQQLTPEFRFSYVALSAGSSILINPNTRFSSVVGLANRPPHVSELFSRGLHHSAASIENGLLIQDGNVITDQDRIARERSHQWVNTFQYNRKSTSLELTAYVNYFENFVYVTPVGTQLTIRGFFPVFQYRQTNTLMAGTDMYFTSDLTRRFAWTSKFSFVYADDRTSENRLPFIPPAQLENAIAFKKSSIGSWRNFIVSLSSLLVFRQTQGPPTIYPRDVTESVLDQTFDFMDAPETYNLFKIEAGVILPLDNRDLSINLAVENLLNTSYRNYMNRLRYYADDIGRNVSVRINYHLHSHHQ